MEVLRFFFDNGWHFAGLVVVLAILVSPLVAYTERDDE
jgi:hypothetical protein